MRVYSLESDKVFVRMEILSGNRLVALYFFGQTDPAFSVLMLTELTNGNTVKLSMTDRREEEHEFDERVTGKGAP